MFPAFRKKQTIDMQCNSIDFFLYDVNISLKWDFR